MATNKYQRLLRNTKELKTLLIDSKAAYDDMVAKEVVVGAGYLLVVDFVDSGTPTSFIALPDGTNTIDDLTPLIDFADVESRIAGLEGA